MALCRAVTGSDVSHPDVHAADTIATAPGALPGLGHILPLMRAPLRFLTALPDHGDLVKIRLGRTTAIVLCDPELTRTVLLEDRIFDKGGPVFDRARETIGGGLATCPHSEHRQLRRLVQPAFHHARLPGYAQTMAAQISGVTDSWRDGQILDVLAEMQAITGRTVVATMFSDALPSATFRQAIEDVRTLVEGVYRRMLVPKPLDRLPTAGNRRYHRASSRLRRTLEAAVVDRRPDSGGRDLVSTLLSTRCPRAEGNGRAMSDEDITDQVTNFFIAGFETSAGLLAWALHLVAEHPRIQRRLHAEVDTVLDGDAAAFEHLPQLVLTDRIISETLRLHPPAWLATRVAAVDTHLGGHTVPAGTTIVYSPYLLHHRPDVFPDPERFDPDRWENGQPPARQRHAFIPFGGGPRRCIGDKFAVTEAVLALATIAARWRLEPVPGHEARAALGVTLRPRGLRLQVTARDVVAKAA